MSISSFPVFVTFPAITDLSVTVFGSDGVEVGRFASPSTIFAVYFSEAGGEIVFTANAATTLGYVAAKSSWGCATYFVSSSPSEKWSASQTKGNFTIGNSQDICLLHVSDAVTEVSGYYETQEDVDRLYYQYSGSTATGQFYTGTGTVSGSSSYLTFFRWSSDDDGLSRSFGVQLSSPLSSFPYRVAVVSGTSAAPILLKGTVGRAGPPRNRVGRGLRSVQELDTDGVLSITAGSIGAAALVGFVLLTLIWRRLREGGRGLTEGAGPQ
jgi:hypothetical protein